MFSEDDLLPLSALQHLLFCERRAALVYIEGLWAENVATLEGSHLHKKVDDPGLEARVDVRIARSIPLRSLRLGLTGKADIVEFHRIESSEVSAAGCSLAGVKGRWMPFPVEYKRGKLRHEDGYEVQLCAQALCLEEMLGCEIQSGSIFYNKTRRRLDVNFNSELRDTTEAAAQRLHSLIASGITPRAFREPKCEHCSLLKLCLPEGNAPERSAARYLEAVFGLREDRSGRPP